VLGPAPCGSREATSDEQISRLLSRQEMGGGVTLFVEMVQLLLLHSVPIRCMPSTLLVHTRAGRSAGCLDRRFWRSDGYGGRVPVGGFRSTSPSSFDLAAGIPVAPGPLAVLNSMP